MTQIIEITKDVESNNNLVYTDIYGLHFNKLLCNYATSLMRKNGVSLQTVSKEYVDNLLTKYSIHLNNNVGYDYIFIANMCKADYYGSSILDERQFALYIKDTIDDEDAGEGTTLLRWCATMKANHIEIDWQLYI